MTTPSRRIAEKARHLPVKAADHGVYIVASGTEPGATYHVGPHDGADPDDPAGWFCGCVAPAANCAHRWAVLAHRDPAVRRMLRRIAAGKPVAVEVAS